MKQLNRESKHWLSLVLLLLVSTFSASATDLVFNEGNESSDQLPIYGMQAGAYQKCEYVIPAEMLSSISGKGIQALKFHVAYASQDFYISECTVFLKEVDFTSYEEKVYSGMDGATVVYSGPLDATDDYMTIPIEQTYTYNGGNLLIGMYIMIREGLGGSVGFRGVSSDVHTGLACYNWDTWTYVENNKAFVDFYPMMTLDCIGMDHTLSGDQTHGTMTFKLGEETVTTAGWGTDISLTVEAEQGWKASNVGSDDVTLEGSGPYTFTMPDKDVYVNCTWLRDITGGYEVEATGPTRIPWTGNTLDPDFKLVDLLQESAELEKGTHYTVSYKDKDGSAVGDLKDVGEYTAVITGVEENGYTGTFELPFTVQKMHEVTLAAGYYGTHFYANAIETFNDYDDAQYMELATVTAVADEVTIETLENTKVAKEYPFLVHNTDAQNTRTFRLWEAIADVTVSNPTPAAQFKGTAVDVTITAEQTADKYYYVLRNGCEFVYVMGEGPQKANRCWIEVEKPSSARVLAITMGSTGISEVKTAANGEGWYDLQGRRMTTVPTQRGLYVIDGKKVVVK